MSEELQPITLDLGAIGRGEVNELFLRAFGNWVELALKRMFGASAAPGLRLKGSPAQIDSFANTLKGEKRYMDAYQRYGLDDPRTFKTKYQLNKAIKQFERSTGIHWPFK